MDPDAVNPLNYQHEAREYILELIQRHAGGEDIACMRPPGNNEIIDTMEAIAAE